LDITAGSNKVWFKRSLFSTEVNRKNKVYDKYVLFAQIRTKRITGTGYVWLNRLYAGWYFAIRKNAQEELGQPDKRMKEN